MALDPGKSKITATVQAETIMLTPVRKRKLRPSLSPAKTVSEAKAKSQSIPKRKSDCLPRSNVLKPSPYYDGPTAALDFKEFSFLGADGRYSLNNVNSDELDAMLQYLADTYSATEMHIEPPFLYITCEKVPPESERPFTIAGFIAVWSNFNDEVVGYLRLGMPGEAEPLSIPTHIEDDLQPQKMPSESSILYLAAYIFQDAISIALAWDYLIVCLPSMLDLDFACRLQNLPRDFARSSLMVLYHNGPLPYSEFRRRDVIPDPSIINGLCDETDYVANNDDQQFYPGTMIQACDDNGTVGSVTAGILVSREGETRLTASYHCWQPLIEKNPSIIGSLMSLGVPVFQGNRDNSPGTWVGNVVERIGETDIALVKLRKPFENKFMELDCAPKKLLHSNDIYPGDDFLIDSFVTGKQRLRCIGIAREIGRARQSGHPSLNGDPELLPSTAVPYIKLVQGLYATNTHHIPVPPRIREGVCGSVLVRCKQIQDPTLSFNEVLAKGEVAGIMHFADLRSKTLTTNNLLCYADPFNELINQGWQVVPTSNQ